MTPLCSERRGLSRSHLRASRPQSLTFWREAAIGSDMCMVVYIASYSQLPPIPWEQDAPDAIHAFRGPAR